MNYLLEPIGSGLASHPPPNNFDLSSIVVAEEVLELENVCRVYCRVLHLDLFDPRQDLSWPDPGSESRDFGESVVVNLDPAVISSDRHDPGSAADQVMW